jgi:hypothetical protein
METTTTQPGEVPAPGVPDPLLPGPDIPDAPALPDLPEEPPAPAPPIDPPPSSPPDGPAVVTADNAHESPTGTHV